MFFLEAPFLTCFVLNPSTNLILEKIWFLWCMTVMYTIAFEVPIIGLYDFLNNGDNKRSLLWHFLEWFFLVSSWRCNLHKIIEINGVWEIPAAQATKVHSLFILF